MTLPVVRPETVADHPAIDVVVSAAFGGDVEVELVRRIRASDLYRPELALVAEIDGRIVGHVMVSGTTLAHDAGERTIAMLSPLAVAPDVQRQGIGGALVRDVTDRAAAMGEPLVILEGGPRYYSRFGFVHSVTRGIHIDLPDWAPAEAAQVLLLPAYDPDDPSLRGHVVYPPAFDGLE